MSDDPHKMMVATMKKIDKLVAEMDDEILIYAINKLCDEMDTRTVKRNKKHRNRVAIKRAWGIIKW